MASARYTLNIKPDEPEEKREYTKKEKFQNFWHYHKFIILGIIAAIIIVVSMIIEVTSVEEADYNIGILNYTAVQQDALDALAAEIETRVEDINGDGEVIVYINQYTLANSDDPDAYVDPNVQMASITKISADLQFGTSIIFLAEDLQTFDEQFELFAYNDTSTPAEDNSNYDNIGYDWDECAILSSLDTEYTDSFDNVYSLQSVFEDYSIALRIWEGTSLENDEDVQEYYNLSVDLFNELTA